METSILHALIMKNPLNYHLNNSTLYLNRRRAKILSDTFMQHISIDNWQVIVLTVFFSTFDFGKCGLGLAKRNCHSVLNLIRKDDLNKLIFAHSNIISTRNLIVSQSISRETLTIFGN